MTSGRMAGLDPGDQRCHLAPSCHWHRCFLSCQPPFLSTSDLLKDWFDGETFGKRSVLDYQSCAHSTQHWARLSRSLCHVLWTGCFLQIVNHGLFSFLAGKTTGIPIHVFGTETHMTAIVGMALGHRPIPNQPPTAAHTANFLLNASGSTSVGASFPPTLKEGPILPPFPTVLPRTQCSSSGI